jgi:hypothetical protein
LAAATVACLASVALIVPAAASGATVVNGDFEAGSLAGWSQVSSPGSGWFAYSGTNAPISTKGPELPPEEEEEIIDIPRQVFPPPQGSFAAISDENGPSHHILYQDIALEPAATHVLSMLVYYKSEAPITVPTPDRLTVQEEPGPEEEPEEEPDNQQYRIDVIKPEAPIATLNPSDILATVFKTNPGDPESMAPTQLSVDLSAFAGQTVRLRLADVDNRFFMNSGADAISITSVPFNQFTLGKKLKLNKKKGTAKLAVTVPNPGIVKSIDVRALHGKAGTSKRKPVRVKRSKATASAAGKVFLKLAPTAAGRKALKAKHKLAFRLQVTYTPTGGTAASQTFKGTLKLK